MIDGRSASCAKGRWKRHCGRANRSRRVRRWRSRSVNEDITWSRHADAHLAILASFQTGRWRRPPVALEPLRQADSAAQPVGAGGAGIRGSLDPAVRSRQPASATGGARGGGANSFYMTPGPDLRAVHDDGDADPARVRLRSDGSSSSSRPIGGKELDRRARTGLERASMALASRMACASRRSRLGAVRARSRSKRWLDGAADAETMRGPMLRALLERRFKLKAHIETEQMPAFALTVAPGGLKMKPVQATGITVDGAGRCWRQERHVRSWSPPPNEPAAAAPPRCDGGEKPSCGFVGIGQRPEHRARWAARATCPLWRGFRRTALARPCHRPTGIPTTAFSTSSSSS